MVREASNLLQSCKQAASLLDRKGAAIQGDISSLKEAMGIMQVIYDTIQKFCKKIV